MLRRLLCAAVALPSLFLPSLARADILAVSVELYGGYHKYDALGLESGVNNALSNLSKKALLKDAQPHYGLAGILRFGTLEAGALLETDRVNTTVGALGGLALEVGGLKLEVLGELGGRKYGDFLKDPNIQSISLSDSWLYYGGVRPGLSFTFGSGVKFLVGVWGFGRWDLSSKNVVVTYSAGGPAQTFKLGGATYGASLRLGVVL